MEIDKNIPKNLKEAIIWNLGYQNTQKCFNPGLDFFIYISTFLGVRGVVIMFSSVGGDATAMFFIYHVNIFTLFFTILFYRQNKLLVGLPLFFGYCISIIILYLLNNPIQSYARIFSVLYNLGAGLIFVLCVFLDIKRFKSGYKIMDIQNLFFGFCLGFLFLF